MDAEAWQDDPPGGFASEDGIRLAAAALLALSGDDPAATLEATLRHAKREELTEAVRYLAQWILSCTVIPIEQFRAELSAMLSEHPESG